jgi:hypothetical protein
MARLQREGETNAGDVAVDRNAAETPGKRTLTDSAQPSVSSDTGAAAAGGRPKHIAQLLQRVGNNPRGLHYALRVDPVLRGEATRCASPMASAPGCSSKRSAGRWAASRIAAARSPSDELFSIAEQSSRGRASSSWQMCFTVSSLRPVQRAPWVAASVCDVPPMLVSSQPLEPIDNHGPPKPARELSERTDPGL